MSAAPRGHGSAGGPARQVVLAATLAATLLGAGCVVVPVTRDVYDADCRMMRREVTLEAAVIGQFHSCGGQECTALLVTLGVVSAATLVVSGSLAVVGNVVFWLEHEANCRRRNAAPAAPEGTPGIAPDPVQPRTAPASSTMSAPAPP